MYETFPNIQEERELLPEIFSVSSLCSKHENDDFNINLSNTGTIPSLLFLSFAEEANNSHQILFVQCSYSEITFYDKMN